MAAATPSGGPSRTSTTHTRTARKMPWNSSNPTTGRTNGAPQRNGDADHPSNRLSDAGRDRCAVRLRPVCTATAISSTSRQATTKPQPMLMPDRTPGVVPGLSPPNAGCRTAKTAVATSAATATPSTMPEGACRRYASGSNARTATSTTSWTTEAPNPRSGASTARPADSTDATTHHSSSSDTVATPTARCSRDSRACELRPLQKLGSASPSIRAAAVRSGSEPASPAVPDGGSTCS